MELKRIEKTININAPITKVWPVLYRDELTRQWYSEFSTGTYAESDWKEGSKVIFKDESNSGIVGKVVSNKPEYLAIEYTGVINDDKEDYESGMAKDMAGCQEIYKSSEVDGITTLEISCDMGEPYFEEMSKAWDRALEKIKQLSESKSN
ncbi:SRPBCC domain-containing protein [Pedobacter sp. HMF7647]|uniref:SRPBCC domain-containing protein n=1 Tax=Hufsiella arboris TaxID=2695275 RepID=A0A7K1Y929_9SPHI|nr:SRPBCC domain-containing protein [Hufsiella arboris]MXV50930.1 SRPBCC domain-containing protein [Hufsiella arboris]